MVSISVESLQTKKKAPRQYVWHVTWWCHCPAVFASSFSRSFQQPPFPSWSSGGKKIFPAQPVTPYSYIETIGSPNRWAPSSVAPTSAATHSTIYNQPTNWLNSFYRVLLILFAIFFSYSLGSIHRFVASLFYYSPPVFVVAALEVLAHRLTFSSTYLSPSWLHYVCTLLRSATERRKLVKRIQST